MQATRTAARPATLRENNGQLPVRVCVRVHVVLCWLAALFGPENKQLDPLLVFSCSAPPQADPKKQLDKPRIKVKHKVKNCLLSRQIANEYSLNLHFGKFPYT